MRSVTCAYQTKSFWNLIQYIKCTLHYQYDVNSVNNNSRGSCNRPYTEISNFWGMKICVSGALARFARSRVLVNKWVKAFYSIEYNQSNINNGSDRPSTVSDPGGATGARPLKLDRLRFFYNPFCIRMLKNRAQIALESIKKKKPRASRARLPKGTSDFALVMCVSAL